MLYYWGGYPFKRLTIIQKYHVWLEWLTKFPLFIKKDHNYSSFTNGGNNIITSWGCVSFKHFGAGSPTVRLILLMELLSKLAIDGVLTQATQCLLFFPSILTSHWLKDIGYKDFPVRARNHVAHSCTRFPCYLGMEIYAKTPWTTTKIVEFGN